MKKTKGRTVLAEKCGIPESDLDAALLQLTFRERTVLECRQGLVADGYVYTRAEVARLWKITPSGVTCIQARAIRKLKQIASGMMPGKPWQRQVSVQARTMTDQEISQRELASDFHRAAAEIESCILSGAISRQRVSPLISRMDRALVSKKSIPAPTNSEPLRHFYERAGTEGIEKLSAAFITRISTATRRHMLSVMGGGDGEHLLPFSLRRLVACTEQEVLSYKRVGEDALAEVKYRLGELGLKLGMSNREIALAFDGRDLPEEKVLPTAQFRRGLLDIELTSIEFSVRAHHCFAVLGLKTLRDLVRQREKDICSLRNFGQTSLYHVKTQLATFGLQLEMSEEDIRRVDAGSVLAPPQEAILWPVSALDLCVRARNCLREEGIETVQVLVQRTAEQMLGIKNFGKTNLREIEHKLHGHGLHLGMREFEIKKLIETT